MIGRKGVLACPLSFINLTFGQTGMSDLPVLRKTLSYGDKLREASYD
jgi:hypothetical protein